MQDNIFLRNRFFYNCIKSKIDFDAIDIEGKIKNLNLIEKLGNFAWRNHPGCFFDAEIENLLISYGHELEDHVDIEKISQDIDSIFSTQNDCTTLHIATEIAEIGGHTRIINQVIKRSKELNQYLVLTGKDIFYVPEWFEKSTEGFVTISSLIKYKTHFEKAFALRLLSNHFKRILIYAHPFDIVPTIAFAEKNSIPVAVDNHAHSWFWYGKAIADLIFCHTEYHTEFTKKYRKSNHCFHLSFAQIDRLDHLPGIEEKAKAKKSINIGENKTVILSAATREKFVPNNEYNFFEILECIVEKYPDVVCIVVGLPDNDPLVKDSAKHERIIFHPVIKDLTNYYLASDICLESMPQPSLGVQLQAPLVGLSCPMPKYGKSRVFKRYFPGEVSLYNQHFSEEMSKNQFFEKLDLLINNEQLRIDIAKQIRESLQKIKSDDALYKNLKELYATIDSLNHIPKLHDKTVFFEDEENIEIAERSELQDLSSVVDYWKDELAGDDLSSFSSADKNSTTYPVGNQHRQIIPMDEKSIDQPDEHLTEKLVKAIAFYLPQYHPVPENDQWWGKGFTEWSNVAKAKPLFPGHYQPHLPADLGFYDLRLPEVRKAQADMARQYGISGFCYYHYWFNGKRLLNRVFDEVMVTGKPDFPFCLCWANENWTRAWDGGDSEILVGQKYSRQDDLDHIKWLIQAFRDPRYIKIYGRPLLLIYRARDLPDTKSTAALWREEVIKAGFPDLYLCKVESFTDEHSDPIESGFNASVEFQPDWSNLGYKSTQYDNLNVFNYADIVDRMIHKPDPGYMRLPCVTPSWDNTPRRGKDGYIFHNSNPVIYEKWLRHAVSVVDSNKPEEKIVFINAWNEWGEGNHLEPDIKSGHAYLHATKRAINIDNQRAMLNEIVTQRAAIALESGDLNKAKKLLLRSLSNDDSAPKTLHQYALILFNEGDIDNSREILLKAIEIDPFNSELHNDLGTVYYAANEISKAKEHFEKALDINPQDITTLKNFTELLINEGKFDEASDRCAILKSLVPGDKDVADFLSLINEKYKVEDSTVDYEKSIDESLRTINIATEIKNTNKQAGSSLVNQPLQNSELYESLLNEKPKFHNDGKGNPISWNTNTRLLNFLDTYLEPGMRTLETGSGYSTVLFIGKKCFHTAISPAQSEFERVSDFCKKHNLSLADVTFIAGNSTDHLPLLNEGNLDVFFIDGAHRFPFPVVDWFYGTKILKQGGIAIVDDTDIISCFILQSFLAQDDHWETVLIDKDFSIFRKLDSHDYPGDWPDQIFSKNKISDAETFLKAFYEIPFDSSVSKDGITKSKYIEASFPTQEDVNMTMNQLEAIEKSKTLDNNELDSKDIDVVSEVAVDWTPAFDYEALTFDEIEEYSNIEVTEELREGGVHAQKAWDYWFKYLSKNIWKTSLNSEIVSFCNTVDNPRILSTFVLTEDDHQAVIFFIPADDGILLRNFFRIQKPIR